MLCCSAEESIAWTLAPAMKNERTFQEMADIQFLLSLPDVDDEEVRSYFERSGLLERYLEIKRLR